MPNVLTRWALAAAVGATASHAFAAPPPAAAFGQLPAIQEAVISPDGQKIALLGSAGDHRIISIAPIDGTQSKTVDVGQADVYGLRWAGTGYLLFDSAVLDRGANQATGVKYAYRLERDFVLTQDGQIVTYLLKDNTIAQFETAMPVLQVLDGPTPEAIVLARDHTASAFTVDDTRFKRENATSLALWQADVATGKGHVSERGQPDTKAFAVGLDGAARARIDYDDKGRAYHLMVRPKAATAWTALLNFTDRTAAPQLLGYSTPEDAIYLEVTEGDGTARIERHDLSGGATSVVGSPGSTGVRFDPYTGAALQVLGGDGDQWLDQGLGQLDAKLSRALPGKTVQLVNWSKDRSRIVVAAETTDSPTTWYLLDTAKGQLSLVGEGRPGLAGVPLGVTHDYSYRARDGLNIPAYLTLPPGSATTGAKPPLIVLPHGGPDDHDGAGFDWMVQFLASRGYAVLRPQFRGSSGYGLAFERAGDHEWGGKIQTDLLDGVAALAANGIVDPHRTCIIGDGFGGYAALAGLTLHGDAYRCAVAINGISDLPLLYGDFSRLYSPDSGNLIRLKEAIGVMASDADASSVISPSRQAARAGGPVLLIASAGGTEAAPYDQTVAMHDALQKAGRPVDLITIDNDDDLSSSAARIQALEAIEAFLARNLPASR